MPNAPTPFLSVQRVHFDMLDALGMLHNAAFLVLFERARFDLWAHLKVTLDAEHFDWPYFVARNEVDYKAPVWAAQDVTVSVAVARMGRSSLTFAHAVRDASGALAAEGRAILVRVDGQSGRPLPWSDWVRELLAPYAVMEPLSHTTGE